ncbi:MAG TPA: N-acetylmuramoyl-L-alanine amidase, partial [Novosphingobium sp.]
RSVGFAQLLLREGQGQLPWRERPLQSAAFVVLKSADVPSVLFETGYISNPADAARLESPAGREAFAAVASRAIRVWLARQQGTAAGTAP